MSLDYTLPPGASPSARASDGLVNRADQFVSRSQAFFFAQYAFIFSD